MWTVITEPKASSGCTSHHGPSMPNRSQRRPLSIPHSELSIQRNEKIVGIEGTAQGRMKITLSQRIQGRCRAKKPDSSRARKSLRLIPMPRNTTVLKAVRVKIGSREERPVALGARAEPEAVDHRPDDEDEEEDDIGQDQDHAPRRFQRQPPALAAARRPAGRATVVTAMAAPFMLDGSRRAEPGSAPATRRVSRPQPP